MRAELAMGAYKAPISHLLSSSSSPNLQSTKTLKTLKTPPPLFTARRSLFFSLASLALSANAKSQNPSFMDALASSFDPLTQAEKDASSLITRRVSEAVELLERGKELQALGDFPKALQFFTSVVENYKDFAFSDYARVGRALALYEVGDREEAIAEMEDVSISLKGYPEVHAALAAALYADKHAPLLAENQFAIATLLDPHFTDLSYVIETKHWPPSLVVENYKDFAFSDYARVGRALALYEVGDREEAIAEMEDVSISLKGYPEVHAALAAALYADKHAPLLAENQFAIATLLDPHFTDLSYVIETKHWPPSLVSSLQHFITLS